MFYITGYAIVSVAIVRKGALISFIMVSFKILSSLSLMISIMH